MSESNSWAEVAGLFRSTRSAFLEHERAKAELKGLMREDAKEAAGHGVRAKRSKSGAVSFDLLDWRHLMQRSSKSIGAIAAALAKAQSELANPEKSLTATIRASPARKRSNLPLRRALRGARHRPQIARQARNRNRADHFDRQGSGIDPTDDRLAHSSGEWLSSEWPVCAISETAAPRRMGPR